MCKRTDLRHKATASLGAIILTHGLLSAFAEDNSTTREVCALLYALSEIEDRINHLLEIVDMYDDDLSLPPIHHQYVGSRPCDVVAG